MMTRNIKAMETNNDNVNLRSSERNGKIIRNMKEFEASKFNKDVISNETKELEA